VLGKQMLDVFFRQEDGVLEIQAVGVLAVDHDPHVRHGKDHLLALAQEAGKVCHELRRLVHVLEHVRMHNRVDLLRQRELVVEEAFDDPCLATFHRCGIRFNDGPWDRGNRLVVLGQDAVGSTDSSTDAGENLAMNSAKLRW
jgi:hypothetical protein